MGESKEYREEAQSLHQFEKKCCPLGEGGRMVVGSDWGGRGRTPKGKKKGNSSLNSPTRTAVGSQRQHAQNPTQKRLEGELRILREGGELFSY